MPGLGDRDESSESLLSRVRSYTRDNGRDRLATSIQAGWESDGAASPRTISGQRRASVSERTPARSFYHRAFHGPLGKSYLWSLKLSRTD